VLFTYAWTEVSVGIARAWLVLELQFDTESRKEKTMAYTIVADLCEGIADCIPVCPVECIHWAEGKTNTKGTKYTYIDDATCIDCGACLSVCPIEGAILDEWKPELQKP
jgi:NAD-dependent dihydropyrimidine dehydrogenase PreA subunit